jgi:hypothetical protein
MNKRNSMVWENDKPWKVGNGCGGDENIHTINVGVKGYLLLNLENEGQMSRP